MSPQTALLAALDQALGFPNRLTSKITKLRQGFDEKAGEHVFWIEYRCRTPQGIQAPPTRPTGRNALARDGMFNTMIDLLQNYLDGRKHSQSDGESVSDK